MIEFSSSFLLKMRRKALRKRVLFNVLNGTERAILYLVPRCVENLSSAKMIDILAKIIVKIKNALKSPILQYVNQVGRPLAKRIGCIALKWGCKTADEWVIDEGFVKYLAIINMNDLSGFRVGDE